MLNEYELILIQLNHSLIVKSFSHFGELTITEQIFDAYFFECGSDTERLHVLYGLLFLFVNAKVR